jgi:GMP synthase (glutamine-hydrolysing)
MADWDIPEFVEGRIASLKETIGDGKAIVAVSGGVDSTVSAILSHRAIDDNLTCIFIDDNFMRLGESEQIKSLLASEPIRLPVRVLNERQRFMSALEGLEDAEEKRKVFRQTFYETLSDVANNEGYEFLIQGTIKADIDETEGGIKTQHNILEQIGIDPENTFGVTIIEPIKSLYKYQVREVARYLGVLPQLSERQPFPGPGLSVRVVGEITPNKLDELKKATFIVEETLAPHLPSQYFAAIFSGTNLKELKVLQRDTADILGLSEIRVKARVLNEKATGIMDGKRAYGLIVITDFLDASENTVEPGYENMTIIRKYLEENYPEATRIMFLVEKREKDGFLVAIRAVKTRDFLTAETMEIPWATLKDASTKILNTCSKVVGVYYDITPKPPATIEFE